MNSEQHNESFDHLFRDAFQGAQTPVPPSVWAGVSASTTGAVATGAATSILSKIIGIKGAAILGGVALVATLYVASNSEKNQDSSQSTVPTSTTIPFETETENSTSTIETEKVEEAATFETKSEAKKFNANANLKATASEAPQQTIADNNQNGGETPLTNTTPPSSPPAKAKQLIDHSSPGVISCNPEQVCANQEATLSFNRNYGENDKIVWYLNGVELAKNTRTVNMIFTKNGLNQVRIKVTSADHQTHEISKSFEIRSVTANFEYEIDNQQVILQSMSTSASHKWYVNNVKQLATSSVITLPINGNNSVEVLHIAGNLYGCSDTVKKTISLISCKLESQLSDAFSPYLLDGINDEWVVDLPPVEKFYLVIFAIDGSRVFESFDQKDSWNGKRFNSGEMLPAGVYTYQLVYGCNGNSNSQSGKINLLK